MDSTYASSLAILRRVLMLEGVLNGRGRRARPSVGGRYAPIGCHAVFSSVSASMRSSASAIAVS